MTRLPTHRNVLAAQRRLRGRVHTTPMLSSRTLSKLIGVEVLFKCENLQKSGSFKYRGALNAVLSLTPKQRRLGLITHSSGNHGAALACVAQGLNIPATVVMPRSASTFKRDAVLRYGGRVVACGATLKSRQQTLAKVAAQSGANFIPPYDHGGIIAGQGTIGLEIVQEGPAVDEIWLPVGGGGLAAGTVVAVGGLVQVVGSEPLLASDAHISLARGERQPAMRPTTLADGLRTALGALNFRVLNDYQLPILLVDEDEILAAQKLVMSCLKVLVEPSSAVPIAALLKYGPTNASTQTIVVVITGGNIQL